MGVNPLKESVEAGKMVAGTFVYSPDPVLVEIAGRAGIDFVIIDTEHGLLDIRDVASLVAAARRVDMTAFVRVGHPTPHAVGRALDAGAAGVVLPHLSDPEVTRDLVRATRYAPEGTRSSCTCSPATNHSLVDFATYAAEADEDVWSVGLIEDRAGVSRLDELLEVSGLNVVMPGMADLAADVGARGVLDHPRVLDAVNRILESVANAPGVYPALYVNALEEIPGWVERGVGIFAFSIDYKLIAQMYQRAISDLKGEAERKVVG
jgi:4-hydroxy-2-oxoheptanedioate aldolase